MGMMMPRRAGVAMLLVSSALVACGRDEPRIEDQPQEPVVEARTGVAPSEPIAPPAWLGAWAQDASHCGRAPGVGDDAPIAFTTNEFLGYAKRCSIGATQEGTEGGWRLGLVCPTETGEEIEILDVDVDVDGDMLRVKREGAPEEVYMRCEGTN